MKDTRVHSCQFAQGSYRTAHLNFSEQSPLLADVSNFCAVEIGLALHVSNVECKTGVFLHMFLLLSELWSTSQNAVGYLRTKMHQIAFGGRAPPRPTDRA